MVIIMAIISIMMVLLVMENDAIDGRIIPDRKLLQRGTTLENPNILSPAVDVATENEDRGADQQIINCAIDQVMMTADVTLTRSVGQRGQGGFSSPSKRT